MTDDTAIRITDLTKRYGKITAVDHISFDVKRGEIFGFLGPNGSGKTTTIRMLTGLSKPSEGRASILGFNILSEITEAKRHIGVVPDTSNLYDELSAEENLHFMAKLFGVPGDLRKARVEGLLKAFSLYGRKDDPFRTFSRGMKRALTVAAALVHDPEVLFLDEPTAGLDVVAARSLRNMISNLRGRGMTIFLTTHYLEEADFLCDRVAIIVGGRIAEIGTTAYLKGLVQQRRTAVEFSFSRDISKLMDDLAGRLEGCEVIPLEGERIRVYADNPGQVYDAVFQFSRDAGVGLEAVNSISPSLEDAFMKITGLSPTVMAVEKGGR